MNGERVSSVAAVALACVAARALPAQQRSLSDADVPAYAAVLQMTDAREVDTAVLRAAWRSNSSPLRVVATRAAGQVHALQMRPVLEHLLQDPDSAVAATAAFSLGLLRDTTSLAVIEHTVRAAPLTVAAAAARALGEMAPASTPGIARLLAQDSLAPAVTEALLLAAARARPVPVERLRPWLASPDSALRWRAAYAVARPLVPSGVRMLLPLARDVSAAVRAQVARALAQEAAGDSLASLAMPVLATLAGDPDPHVRVNALRAAASYGPRAAATLLHALGDPDPNVRVAAAASLGAAMPATDPRWDTALAADTSFAYRRSLAIAMARAGAPALAALHWRTSPRWEDRAALAEAAAGAPSGEMGLVMLRPLTVDSDGRVRAAALASLVALDDSTPRLAAERDAMLRRGLVDADPIVRAAALGGLTSHPEAADVPLLLASYERAAFDSAVDARVAAVRGLVMAWARDSSAMGPALRQQIRELPAPPAGDRITRAAGQPLTLLDSWRASHAARPPLAWYESRVRTLVRPALEGQLPRVDIVTWQGTITLELFAADAPLTVDNFLTLIRNGYYRGTRFHRVVPNFVVQDGDPRGDGNGGPPYTIRDELNRHRYDRGTLGMALSGPDTGGSQYFITLSPQPHLDGGYTIFGRVVRGESVLDSIVQGDRILAMRIR